MFLEQGRGIDGAGEGGIGDRQVELELVQAGLLEQALRHLRIVFVLRLRIDRELTVGAIGLSLAGVRWPENTLCGDLVAIDGEFDRVAHVGVVEGRPASRSSTKM